MFTFQETNNYSQITWRENEDCCNRFDAFELRLHMCPVSWWHSSISSGSWGEALQACTCCFQSTDILVSQKVLILEFMRPGKEEEPQTQKCMEAACPWGRKNPVQLATQWETLSLPSYTLQFHGSLSRNSPGRRQTPYPCIKCHVQPCWLLVLHYQIINSIERISGATSIS